MNKTIIININGIVFHIEEDAYEILKSYMTDVKRHFMNSADSLEITTDIENRIAEMFSEILVRENKQVIVEQDVSIVVEQMGSVADFENADADANEASNGFSYNNNTESRRLFRDPDDHLIGGVCAGIANYFDVDVVWIRLAFALTSVFAGSGFMLYVILWIVVPKAITRADRMAMKGEKQNLQGFKKNFEEELSSVKQHFGNFGNEARPFVYKTRDFASDFFHHLGVFFRGAGRVFVKMLGVIILMMCFGFIIAIVVITIGFTVLGREPVGVFPFNVIHNELANRVYISAFLVAFIPLISIILVTLSGIFKIGTIGRSTGSIFLVVWIVALGMLIFDATRIAGEFRESARFTQTINIKPTASNTYYLKLNDIKYFSHEDSVRLNIKDHFQNMIVSDDDANGFHNNEPRSVNIRIERSDINKPVLEESFRASGANFEDALFNARNTSYVFAQQDTILKFDYTLRKRPNIYFHAEEVDLILKVPLNARLVIDERLDNYLHDVNIYECKRVNKRDQSHFSEFTMTDNGLQCKVDTVVTPKIDSAVKK